MSIELYLPSSLPPQVERMDSGDGQHTLEPANERHAHTGVYCLPPELLIEIFLLLQSISLPRKDPEHLLPPKYWSGWMTVLHVCVFWRKVALAAPVLWKVVDARVLHPDSICEVLARSADLHLRLTAETHFEFPIWFDGPVLQRLETLAFNWKAHGDQFPKLFLQAAPNIRQLILSCNYAHLPREMLGSHCPPHLRQLSLTRCSVPLGFSLFSPALTHLKLDWADLDAESESTSVEQITSLLAVLHALECLCLDLYPVIHTVGLSLQQTSLHRLDHFSLKLSDDVGESPITTLSLLQNLSIVPTAEMIVSTDIDGQTDYTIYLPLLSTVFPDGASENPHLQLALVGHDHWALYQWNPVTKSRVGKRCTNMLSDSMGPEASLVELSDFIVSVRPQSIVILGRMWQALLEYSEIWVEMDEIEHVQCLTICYCDHQHLWSILDKRPTQFPHLKTITMTDKHQWWQPDSENEADDDLSPAESDVSLFRHKSDAHECAVDTTSLSAVASGLVAAIQKLRSAGVLLREVRIESRPARWGGDDALRTSFSELGDLKLVADASSSGGAMDGQVYSLLL